MTLENEEAIAVLKKIAKRPVRDSEDFARLFKAYNGLLVGFLIMRTRSREDAEDIAQEAWTRFWVAIPQFDLSHSMKILNRLRLKGIQAAIDKYKVGKEARRLTALFSELSRLSEDDSSVEERISDPAPNVEEQLDDWETQLQLLRIAFVETKSEPWELEVHGFHRYFGRTSGELTAAEFTTPPVRALAEWLIGEFHEARELPPDEIAAAFARLRGMVAPAAPGDLTWPQCTTKKFSPKVIEGWARNVFRRTAAIAASRLRPRL